MAGRPAWTRALQGRELGTQVILIESDRLGDQYQPWSGAGPPLARAARLVRDTQAWPAFGLRGPGPEVDLAATLENAGRVADYAHQEQRLSGYVAGTGIELVEGTGPARFADPYTVAVGDGRTWQANRIIVAVGGHPGRLPIAGAELALTYTDLRALMAAERGRIPVNDWLQTNVAHIFAAENAVLGTRRRVAHEIVPTRSFTDPEYASVGLTEAKRANATTARSRLSAMITCSAGIDRAVPGAQGAAGTVVRVVITVVFTSLAGVVLCCLRLRSDSLLAPVLAHWTVNALGVIVTLVA